MTLLTGRSSPQTAGSPRGCARLIVPVAERAFGGRVAPCRLPRAARAAALGRHLFPVAGPPGGAALPQSAEAPGLCRVQGCARSKPSGPQQVIEKRLVATEPVCV